MEKYNTYAAGFKMVAINDMEKKWNCAKKDNSLLVNVTFIIIENKKKHFQRF